MGEHSYGEIVTRAQMRAGGSYTGAQMGSGSSCHEVTPSPFSCTLVWFKMAQTRLRLINYPLCTWMINQVTCSEVRFYYISCTLLHSYPIQLGVQLIGTPLPTLNLTEKSTYRLTISRFPMYLPLLVSKYYHPARLIFLPSVGLYLGVVGWEFDIKSSNQDFYLWLVSPNSLINKHFGQF